MGEMHKPYKSYKFHLQKQVVSESISSYIASLTTSKNLQFQIVSG